MTLLRKRIWLSMILCVNLLATVASAQNHVLSLDGDGDYVEIENSEVLNAIDSQVTLEAWIQVTAFTNIWTPILYKGDTRSSARANRSYTLWLTHWGTLFLASAPTRQGEITLASPTGLIAKNRWYHVAGVIDAKRGVMKIFLNGMEVARCPFGQDIYQSALPFRIGWTHEETPVAHGPFAGLIDAVRVWNIARTEAEIGATMGVALSGKEPGLVGYWPFEGDSHKGTLAPGEPSRHEAQFLGDAVRAERELPTSAPQPAVLSGFARNEAQTPLSQTNIRLAQGHETIAEVQTDAQGRYSIVTWNSGKYNLYATLDTLGDVREGISVRAGKHVEANLTLKEAVSIEGTLLQLDNLTPHISAHVQAVMAESNVKSEPIVVGATLSDEAGKYRFINLPKGRYTVRCYTGRGYVYYGESTPAVEGEVLSIERDKTLTNIDFHMTPFKKGTWKHLTTFDGLVDNGVWSVYQDSDGAMWFGTQRGVSRYDGKRFTTFTEKEGLAPGRVVAIDVGPDGNLWFGTRGGGVSRYDGEKFVTFTTTDGLASDTVNAIYPDPAGLIWFACGRYREPSGGVSHYDGNQFVTFTTKDGLASNNVTAISRASDEAMWFGRGEAGVSRYDGATFVNFTTADGLSGNTVLTVESGADGAMWFGTTAGISRYRSGDAPRDDNKQFVTFRNADGLVHNTVGAIYRESSPETGGDGVLWFGTGWGAGTVGRGVSRYDGNGFISFTPDDGLPHGTVRSIYRAADGVLWFGTQDGVSRYDETSFINFTTKDGLAHDSVKAIHRSPDGTLWFGTDGGGVSKYDGVKFVNLGTADGLVTNQVRAIEDGEEGTIWFGGNYGGPAHYNGQTFRTLDKLPSWVPIGAIHRDRDGSMWFGAEWDFGLTHYDGNKPIVLTTEDGLAGNVVFAIHQDRDGLIWVGTDAGVSRYDGKGFINLTTEDGLVDNAVNAIYRAADGNLWFGTNGGVSRYDDSPLLQGEGLGVRVVNLTASDGLAHDRVNSIAGSDDGLLWFGTSNGVSLYDGIQWSSIDTRDGLAGNNVSAIYPDDGGSVWFATDGGITRYRRGQTAPTVHITKVSIDKDYTNLSDIPSLTTGTRATISYQAMDFKTVTQKQRYRVRIREIHSDWLNAPQAGAFDYTFEKPGRYTFEVVAIDRDLNYSTPASLTLKVVPPWYLNGWVIFSSIGVLVLLIGHSTMATIRYFQSQAKIRQQNTELADTNEQLADANEKVGQLNAQLSDENVRMGAELQVTKKIQRLILPSKKELLAVGNLDIAAYMSPADEVGGDYYDVLQHESRLVITIGDVTGHGMESGMVMLMTQSIVRALLARGENDPVQLLDALNQAIFGNVQRMDSDKSLTLCLLDYANRQVTLSGQHDDPIIVRADGAIEVVDTQELGFPIGLDDNIADFIGQTTIQLASGDGIVLYTDGITEAENGDKAQYGFERLCDVVSRHWSKPVEAIKDTVVADLEGFIGEAEIYDDITLVILKQI